MQLFRTVKFFQHSLFVALAVTAIFPAGASAQNGAGQSGYVCEQINPDTGNCDFWRQVYIPPADRQYQNYGYYSYGNDYRRPPAQAQGRRPSTQNVSPGSAIMPSTEYAPGFGTSFAAPQDFGRK